MTDGHKKLGELTIRVGKTDDYKALAQIYQAVFQKHNVLQGEQKTVIAYLNQKQHLCQQKDGNLLVALSDGICIGGLYYSKTAQDVSGNHTRWKYNHVAVHPHYTGQGVGSELVSEVERILDGLMQQGNFSSAKIELGVGEDEKPMIPFYEKLDYKQEGTLADHYRFGEPTYLLGKTLVKTSE